jgi:hypothetical protein
MVPILALMWLLSMSPTTVQATKQECALSCSNGGVCKERKAPISKKAASASGTSNSYCHCPSGFSGPTCQIKYNSCPTRSTDAEEKEPAFCSNSAPCIRDVNHDGEVFFHCECNDAVTDYSTEFVRRACQHASTVFCGNKLDRKSLGLASDAYCINGGTCKDREVGANDKDTRHHAGCNCPVGVWKGAHCEILADDKLADKYHYYDASENETYIGNSNIDIVQSQAPHFHVRVILSISLVVLGTISLTGMAYLVYDTNRQNSYRRLKGGRKEKATRIPKQISLNDPIRKDKMKKGPRFEPLELDDLDA